MCSARVLLFTSPIRFIIQRNRIGGVTVSMFTWNAVDRGFEPRSGQTKDYYLGICCFSAKHATQMSKRTDWLARNQNNVSKWTKVSLS